MPLPAKATIFNRIRGLLGLKAATRAESRRLPMPRGYGDWYGGWGGGSGSYLFGTPGPVDWAGEAGNVRLNSAVSACIGWITTSWAQAPYQVVKQGASDDEDSPVKDHPAVSLLTRPNPAYSGKQLQAAWFADFIRGNAYTYIVTDENNVPIDLQYLPRHLVFPVGDERSLITEYHYRPDGRRDLPPIPVERMLHFRNGIDPEDPKSGVDMLASVFPEIATDREATGWQHGLVKRGGAPPWVASPEGKDEGGAAIIWEPEEAALIKQKIMESTSEGRRGEGVAVSAAVNIEKLGFSPREMVMGETQRKAEERIAAQFGLPPVVVGLGAGLDRSTFNNYEEARQAAWEDCIIPLQDHFADELNAKLLPLFADGDASLMLTYDRSGIRCLQDDESAKIADAVAAFKGGIIDRATAKAMMGQKPEEGDKGVYFATSAPSAPSPGDDDFDDDEEEEEDPEEKLLRLPFAWGRGDKKTSAPETKREGQVAAESDLYRAVDEFRAGLARREARSVSAMNGALIVAHRAIQGKLSDLLARMREAEENGQIVTESWLRGEERYLSLLAQLQDAMDAFNADAAPKVEKAQLSFARLAEREAGRLAQAAAGDAPSEGISGLTWNRLPRETLETLAGMASDGSPLMDLLREVGEAQAQAVRDALFSGVAMGKGADEIERGVKAALKGHRNRARYIARTEPLRAAREASRLSYEANSDVVTGYRRLSAADMRTCAACWALHGTLYETEQRFVDHIQCRCCMVPEVKSWAEITGDESLPDTRPQIESGETLFARLTDEQQAAILGPGHYEQYRAGVPLSAFVVTESSSRWGESVRVATVQEAATA